MKPEEKQKYLEALKEFDTLPEEERFKTFAQMENAKVCMAAIVEELQRQAKDLPGFFGALDSQNYSFIKSILEWCAVYMKAGLEVGYTSKKENEK